MTKMAAAILAAITLGGSFGEAGASTVTLEAESVVVDLYVDVTVSAQSVVAHLSTGEDDTRVISLIHRGGARYGIRTEIPRKDYMVVFEAIGDTGHLSEPATLTSLGAQLTVPGSPDTTDPAVGDDDSPESARWGWLAVALGAASLSALAFWVLGGRDDREEAVIVETQAEGVAVEEDRLEDGE